jgi:5'(3')-deoxyribonucleotidase
MLDKIRKDFKSAGEYI